MNTTWMICDSDGYAIAEGLQSPEVSDEAADLAQEIADANSDVVTLCRSDLTGREYQFRPRAN